MNVSRLVCRIVGHNPAMTRSAGLKGAVVCRRCWQIVGRAWRFDFPDGGLVLQPGESVSLVLDPDGIRIALPADLAARTP